MKLRQVGLVLMASTLFLVGCSDKEEIEKLKQERVNFTIIDDYDYDRVKVVIEDELTASELANETLRKKVGLTTGGVLKYDKLGIAENQGVFVETAIADGSVIPTKSGFTDKEIKDLKNNDTEAWKQDLIKSFSELESGRKKSLASLNENIDKESELTAEIEKAAVEQKKRIAEQEKALKEQQKQEKAVDETE